MKSELSKIIRLFGATPKSRRLFGSLDAQFLHSRFESGGFDLQQFGSTIFAPNFPLCLFKCSENMLLFILFKANNSSINNGFVTYHIEPVADFKFRARAKYMRPFDNICNSRIFPGQWYPLVYPSSFCNGINNLPSSLFKLLIKWLTNRGISSAWSRSGMVMGKIFIR